MAYEAFLSQDEVDALLAGVTGESDSKAAAADQNAGARAYDLSSPDRVVRRRKQTLEQFPLDSLDMVGTLGKGGGVVALVMAPDKVTYRVQAGAYMGQSDGRVTGVFEDHIELVELVPDGAGGWLERPATVALEDQ